MSKNVLTELPKEQNREIIGSGEHGQQTLQLKDSKQVPSQLGTSLRRPMFVDVSLAASVRVQASIA